MFEAGGHVHCEHAHMSQKQCFRSHDHLICRLYAYKPVRPHNLSGDRLSNTRKHEEGTGGFCFKYGTSGDVYENADDGVQLHILGENLIFCFQYHICGRQAENLELGESVK